MCNQVKDYVPSKVLEIGCGTGEGTFALYDAFGCEIVSLEENPQCMLKAQNLLKGKSVECQVHQRLRYLIYQDGRHRRQVFAVPSSDNGKVTIIQGDAIFEDPQLDETLKAAGPFDLVVVWLMGTFNMGRSCMDLDHLKIKTPREYVLRVQNQVYRSADRWLRSGGALQVVDRGQAPDTDEHMASLIKAHSAQASSTSLKVNSVTYRFYEEIKGCGIPLVTSNGDTPDQMAMVSIVSIKA